jgi:hypothetical protein
MGIYLEGPQIMNKIGRRSEKKKKNALKILRGP